jgi:WhiB family redox-sensing transcriptional regulator
VSTIPVDRGWRDLALCGQVDPEIFFPEKGQPSLAAKKVCAMCEVTAECLEFALVNDERFGVWGGTSRTQRRLIMRRTHTAGQ